MPVTSAGRPRSAAASRRTLALIGAVGIVGCAAFVLGSGKREGAAPVSGTPDARLPAAVESQPVLMPPGVGTVNRLPSSPALQANAGESPSSAPTTSTRPSATPLPSSSPRRAARHRGASAPAIVPPKRPRTGNSPVPAALLASLGTASTAMPLPYRDGCHGAPANSGRCFYGNLRSRTTIALFGDSHALAWFPALLDVARDRGWRLLSLTRSACGPAQIIPYNPHLATVIPGCQGWRSAAIDRLVRLRPDVILVSGTRGFATIDARGRLLDGRAKTNAWIRGMRRTLTRLARSTSRVILLADTPVSGLANPASCLARHRTTHRSCATPVKRAINYTWLNTEYAVAKATRVAFLDPERWVCPTSPCPEVVGGHLVHRNGGHLALRFAAAQAGRFERAILKELALPRRRSSP